MSFRFHLFTLFILSSVVALLHHGAMTYYWYWTYWWFDLVVHFLGGATVGAGALIIYHFTPLTSWLSRSFREWFFVGILVLFIACLWEFFELWAGISPDEPQYMLDVITDIISGVSGGVSILFLIQHLRK